MRSADFMACQIIYPRLLRSYQEKMLKVLEKTAQKAGLAKRLEIRICHQHDMGFHELKEAVDFALAFAVVHEVPNPSEFFSELYATIKATGRVLVAEPSPFKVVLHCDRIE